MIKDGKYDSLREAAQPYFCLPLSQIGYYHRLDFHVRAQADPRGVIPAVLREIQQLDPSLPTSNVLTHAQFLGNSVRETAGPVEVLGPMSLLALTLALVGVYGVMAHAVSRRTHELAIRMALGAGRGDVLRLVLRQGLRTTLAGLVLGLAGALVATRALAGFLYQVSPLDPAVFAGVSLILATVAMLACLVPSLRAARLQPASALRFE
jgi:predicted lysophospholipase L1 biosynthesis ABC-type transport system permease subunit